MIEFYASIHCRRVAGSDFSNRATKAEPLLASKDSGAVRRKEIKESNSRLMMTAIGERDSIGPGSYTAIVSGKQNATGLPRRRVLHPATRRPHRDESPIVRR
jgi:hypothetical protein